MAPEKESEGSGITGIVTVVGIVCGFIGAAIGAFATHRAQRESQQQSHSGKLYTNGGTCPMCLSDMEQLRVLPCGHQYHHNCVEDMKKHTSGERKCPVCRKTFYN